MNLLIVGSVAFDSIETPFGKVNKTLGGSASYFSLAASYFAKPSIVAVVGRDFNEFDPFKKRQIDLSGLQKRAGKTFFWAGKYHFDLNSRDTLKTRLGVFENFKPKLSPKDKNSQYVFLGNIHPKLQLNVLSQIKRPKFVGMDTMNFWIEKARADLLRALKLVNVFVINDSEARQLSGEHNILKAAKKILGIMQTPSPLYPHPSTLIIKRGEYGLLMFQLVSLRVHPKQSETKIFHLPGYPLEDVADPTGAGDSFAGGFMGYLCRERPRPFPTWNELKKACVCGSAMASFSVSEMGTKGLLQLSAYEIKRRAREFKKLVNF